MRSGDPILVINPPLRVPPRFVDYPPFSFFGPMLGAAVMRARGLDAAFLDCFVLGAVTERDGALTLGDGCLGAVRKAVARTRTVVIAFSPFQRHEGLRSAVVEQVITAVAGRGREVWLADFDDGSCHYLDYRTADARRVYRGIEGVFRRGEVPFVGTTLAEAFTGGVDRVGDPGAHAMFLEECRTRGIIKDLHGPERVFPYLTSVGCPHRCTFCTGERRPQAALSPAEVAGDFARFARAGVARVAVLDAYANADRRRFEAVLEAALAAGLSLHFTNGLGLARIDPPIAALLAKTAGTVYVSPESPDPATLKTLGKPFTALIARRAIAALRDAGVDVHAHFIAGAPGETRARIAASLRGIAAWADEAGFTPHVQPYVAPGLLAVGVRRRRSVYDLFARPRDRWLAAALDAAARRFAAPNERKLIVNVGYACTNDCVFCSVADRPRKDGRFVDQARALARAADDGTTLLDIDGGEPLLYRHLFDVIDLADGLGFTLITVTTNGRRLLPDVAGRLASHRSVRILVSIHGPEAATHDALTRSPGSFDETARGIQVAAAAGILAGVNVTVTAGNWRGLPAIPAVVHRLGARALNLQLYTPFGDVDPALAPPPQAIGAVRAAVRDAETLGMTVNLVNFLPCAAPHLAALMAGDVSKEARRMLFADGRLVNLAAYLGGRRRLVARCRACAHAAGCRGVWNYA